MELTRLDYEILTVLKEQKCLSHFTGMTLREIISAKKALYGAATKSTSRPAIYRKMMKLLEYGYVEKGCKSVNADTFYLMKKSLVLLENK